MTRNLTMLVRKLPVSMMRSSASDASVMFRWGVVAILTQFLMPYVVLDAVLGLPSERVKTHPATMLVLLGGVYALIRGGKPFAKRCRDEPGVMLFVFAIPALALYSIYFVGYSGSAIYLDTYWSAGLLAIMLETASPKQKRFLAKLLIALCVFNVFVALIESFTHTLWFPLHLDGAGTDDVIDIDEAFRANAFFNHPLTASLITSMAVFLLYGMRMRLIYAAPIFGILLVGLFAYGGRTALGITLVAIAGSALWTLFRGIVLRNLKPDFLFAFFAGCIIIPALIAIIVTQTNLGDRIMETLYVDGSAEVRITQWEVFKWLSLKDWLFGISHDDLNVIKYQIGLGGSRVDIENFWILMLLNLGLIGFTAFLVVFGAFLWHLGTYSRNISGWLLVITALIIDSSSNSLGVKSNDLFVETAFLVAMSGYADYKLQWPARAAGYKSVTQHQGVLGAISKARSRGLRALPIGRYSSH